MVIIEQAGRRDIRAGMLHCFAIYLAGLGCALTSSLEFTLWDTSNTHGYTLRHPQRTLPKPSLPVRPFVLSIRRLVGIARSFSTTVQVIQEILTTIPFRERIAVHVDPPNTRKSCRERNDGPTSSWKARPTRDTRVGENGSDGTWNELM